MSRSMINNPPLLYLSKKSGYINGVNFVKDETVKAVEFSLVVNVGSYIIFENLKGQVFRMKVMDFINQFRILNKEED